MIGSTFCQEDKSFPLLALAIHNGHAMPKELLAGCGIDSATRTREEDPFTDGFACLFPNHVVLETSRFAVDLNRHPDKSVYQVPEDAWGLPVRKEPINAELLEKLQAAHMGWYRLLKHQIERMLTVHPRLLVLDLHSYNHRRGGPEAIPDSQQENPDIILGRNNLHRNHYPLVQILREKLDGMDYMGTPLDCRCDVKFSGGYLSRWINTQFPDSTICLAIEFKKIFMNEWTGELDLPAYEALKSTFHRAVLEWLETIT